MKKIILVIATIFYLLSSNLAQAETSNWNGSFSLSYQRKYLAIKASKNIYNFPMLWGNLRLNHRPSGLFFNLWGSENARFRGNFDSERGNEVEFTSGWKKNWDNFYYSELSATLYNVHFSDWDTNSWISTLKIGKKINPQLKCELWLEWLSPIRKFCDGGPIITLKVPYVYKKALGFEKLSLLWINMLIWNNFGSDDPDGIFLRQYFDAEYSLIPNVNVFGDFTPLWKLTKTDDDRKNEHTYSFGVKYLF